MRKTTAVFILALVLSVLAVSCAQAARTYRTWEDVQVKLYSPREKDWTYVTQENYEENMELILAHGFDEADARKRFEAGETVFEAYHVSALKDGCLRLQVIETDYTRAIWDHTALESDERSEFLEDLKNDRTDLPFDFRAPKFATWNGGGKNNYIASGFVSMPPYTYESGRLNMQIRNGKAYVLSYVAKHPQSRWDVIRDKEEAAVVERLKDMNLMMERLPDIVELSLDFPMACMHAVDNLSFSGESEKGAVVRVDCEGAYVDCVTEENGDFHAKIVFEVTGEHEVVVTAMKEERTDTVKRFTVNVSDDQLLVLEKAPLERMQAGKQTFSGLTKPGMEVSIIVGGQLHAAEVDEEGRFTVEIDMDRHGAQSVLIEAADSGVVSANIEYETFVMADQEERIRQARARCGNVSVKRFVQQADELVGEWVSYEARVDEIVHVPGGLNLRVSTRDADGDRQRYMLQTKDYMGDQIYEEMRLTFYGEIQGVKKMTKGNGDTVELPCVLVDCAKWVVLD